MAQTERAQPVHQLLNAERHGVLSTLSQKLEGWPYGSLVPFAINKNGEPLVLLSALAEHTQNLLHDPRVSLFVQDSSSTENPQAGARATLMCTAHALAGPESNEAQENYVGRFPQSVQLLQLGDFKLFKLKIERIRYIGGFGDMYWIGRNDFMARPSAE